MLDGDGATHHVERAVLITGVVPGGVFVEEQHAAPARRAGDHVVGVPRHPGRHRSYRVEHAVRDIRSELPGLQHLFCSLAKGAGVEQACRPWADSEHGAGGELQPNARERERQEGSDHVVVAHPPPDPEHLLGDRRSVAVSCRPPEDRIDAAGARAQPHSGSQPVALEGRHELGQRSSLKRAARDRAGQDDRQGRPVTAGTPPRSRGHPAPSVDPAAVRGHPKTRGPPRLAIPRRRRQRYQPPRAGSGRSMEYGTSEGTAVRSGARSGWGSVEVRGEAHGVHRRWSRTARTTRTGPGTGRGSLRKSCILRGLVRITEPKLLNLLPWLRPPGRRVVLIHARYQPSRHPSPPAPARRDAHPPRPGCVHRARRRIRTRTQRDEPGYAALDSVSGKGRTATVSVMSISVSTASSRSATASSSQISPQAGHSSTGTAVTTATRSSRSSTYGRRAARRSPLSQTSQRIIASAGSPPSTRTDLAPTRSPVSPPGARSQRRQPHAAAETTPPTARSRAPPKGCPWPQQ